MASFEYNHPLISHKIAILRMKRKQIQSYLERSFEWDSFSYGMYEAAKDLKLKSISVKTPIQKQNN